MHIDIACGCRCFYFIQMKINMCAFAYLIFFAHIISQLYAHINVY